MNVMQLNKNNLDRLLAMDDASLAQTILALSKAAGVDPVTANAAVRDLNRVRAGLAGATNGDLTAAVDMLGEERVRALLTLLASHG